LTAKKSQQKCSGKGKKNLNISRSQKFFQKQRKKSETEGNASLPQGGWTPLKRGMKKVLSGSLKTFTGII